MNIQEYISSGIIECYVLGLATSEEQQEFERICAAHSEVKQARETLKPVLSNIPYLTNFSLLRNLKSKIFAGIDIENDQNKSAIYNRLSQATAKPVDNTQFQSDLLQNSRRRNTLEQGSALITNWPLLSCRSLSNSLTYQHRT